jgi:uncharacterized protein (DUF1330 family)
VTCELPKENKHGKRILDHPLSFGFRPDRAGGICKTCGAAIAANGGRFLARGEAVKAYEQGIVQRTTVTEFDSVEQAIAAHDSLAYREALKVLGNACERDVRIVGGLG